MALRYVERKRIYLILQWHNQGVKRGQLKMTPKKMSAGARFGFDQIYFYLATAQQPPL